MTCHLARYTAWPRHGDRTHESNLKASIATCNSTAVSSFTTPGHADTTAYGTGYSSGNIYLNSYGGTYSDTSSAYVNAQTTYTPPQTYYFFKPRSGLLIQCFIKKPGGIYTFDAAFLQQSLRQKYRIKPSKTALESGASTVMQPYRVDNFITSDPG